MMLAVVDTVAASLSAPLHPPNKKFSWDWATNNGTGQLKLIQNEITEGSLKKLNRTFLNKNNVI